MKTEYKEPLFVLLADISSLPNEEIKIVEESKIIENKNKFYKRASSLGYEIW